MNNTENQSAPRERPILFSAPMVRAILDGRKTVTRRTVKPQYLTPEWSVRPAAEPRHERHSHDWWLPSGTAPYTALPNCPYGRPGDRLWVRETWQGPLVSSEEMEADPSWHKDMKRYQDAAHCAYRASGDSCEYVDLDGNFHCRWRPSIHMPRWASRILLEVTAVRVERLQGISEEQAVAEGCYTNDEYRDLGGTKDLWPCPRCQGWQVHPTLGSNLGVTEVDCRDCDTAQKRFAHLWRSINGSESWDANPWVWVVEFRRVTP